MRTSTSKMRSTACRRSPGLGSQNRPNMGGGTRANAAGPAAGTGPSMAAHAAGSSTATARSAWRRFMDSLDTKANLQADRVQNCTFQAGHPGQKGPKTQTTPTCTIPRHLLVDTCIATCAVPTLDWLSPQKNAKKLDTSQPRVLVDGCTNHSFCITPPILCIDDSCSCV